MANGNHDVWCPERAEIIYTQSTSFFTYANGQRLTHRILIAPDFPDQSFVKFVIGRQQQQTFGTKPVAR